MHPYDEYDDNKEVSSTDNEPEIISDEAPALYEPLEGEYHFIRPDNEQRFYTDANYIPHSEATEPSRYYTPDTTEVKSRREKRKKSGGMSFAKVACLCMVCALLGGVGGGAVGLGIAAKNNTEIEGPEDTVTPQDLGNTLGTDHNWQAQPLSSTVSAKDIYELGCEQTVGVSTEITTRNVFGMVSSGSVTGSGFIISEDGYIMTNYHVIESAYEGGYEIKVMLYSGDSYVAEIVGFDAENDIAVLKISATGLSAVTFGDSDKLSVGDTVYAIGNPLGELAYSMTGGIVSATDRVISTDESTSINMFQMDAAVNSGNSGGPVYNASGQVVGVVTAKYSETGVEGLSFAIPISDAVRIATDVIENGYVTGKGFLGVSGQTIDSMTAQYYNMPRGLYVNLVETGSCAEAAGIRLYDIITQVGDKTITSREELSSAVKSCSAGDSVEIIIWRSGEYYTLTVTLDEYVPEISTGDQTPQNQQGGDPYGGYVGNNDTYRG